MSDGVAVAMVALPKVGKGVVIILVLLEESRYL
jgi:hypothetical protein